MTSSSALWARSEICWVGVLAAILNEIESVTNINSNITSMYLPVNKIVCEITQAYNGARSLTEQPSAPREPPLFYRIGNSIDIVNQLFD